MDDGTQSCPSGPPPPRGRVIPRPQGPEIIQIEPVATQLAAHLQLLQLYLQVSKLLGGFVFVLGLQLRNSVEDVCHGGHEIRIPESIRLHVQPPLTHPWRWQMSEFPLFHYYTILFSCKAGRQVSSSMKLLVLWPKRPVNGLNFNLKAPFT